MPDRRPKARGAGVDVRVQMGEPAHHIFCGGLLTLMIIHYCLHRRYYYFKAPSQGSSFRSQYHGSSSQIEKLLSGRGHGYSLAPPLATSDTTDPRRKREGTATGRLRVSA